MNSSGTASVNYELLEVRSYLWLLKTLHHVGSSLLRSHLILFLLSQEIALQSSGMFRPVAENRIKASSYSQVTFRDLITDLYQFFEHSLVKTIPVVSIIKK